MCNKLKKLLLSKKKQLLLSKKKCHIFADSFGTKDLQAIGNISCNIETKLSMD